MPKITKRLVDGTAPTGKDFVLWDDEMSCFGLRVKPSGAKSYIIQYRNVHGRTRKYTVGRHGILTPDEARSEARLLLAEVERGGDPAGEKRTAREAPTLREIAGRYMDEHAKVKKKPRSIREDKRLLDKVILPVLGPRKLGDITRADIAKFHHSLREAPYQANRVLALLSKIFNLAEKWGLKQDNSNPCRHIEKFKEEKKERYLTHEKLARLGVALSDIETSGEELPQAIAAIRLLVLTGARLSEILTLQWTNVDIHRRELALPDSKTGKKTIQLGEPAVEVLTNMPQSVGNPYVIAGQKAGQHLVGLPKIWGRIRKKAGLSDIRIHDLRHSYASTAAQAGLSLPFIGALLGHREVATTNRYVHLMSDPLKAAAALVSELIDTAMKRKPLQRGEVIKLKG
jgi:integrase